MRIIRRRIVPLCALGVLSAVTYLSPTEPKVPPVNNFTSSYLGLSTDKYKLSFYVEASEPICESQLVTKLFEK